MPTVRRKHGQFVLSIVDKLSSVDYCSCMTPKQETQQINHQAELIREIREELVSELNELEGMNVSLDEARERFIEDPNHFTATQYVNVAQEYADDGFIEDGTLQAIKSETRTFIG